VCASWFWALVEGYTLARGRGHRLHPSQGKARASRSVRSRLRAFCLFTAAFLRVFLFSADREPRLSSSTCFFCQTVKLGGAPGRSAHRRGAGIFQIAARGRFQLVFVGAAPPQFSDAAIRSKRGPWSSRPHPWDRSCAAGRRLMAPGARERPVVISSRTKRQEQTNCVSSRRARALVRGAGPAGRGHPFAPRRLALPGALSRGGLGGEAPMKTSWNRLRAAIRKIRAPRLWATSSRSATELHGLAEKNMATMADEVHGLQKKKENRAGKLRCTGKTPAVWSERSCWREISVALGADDGRVPELEYSPHKCPKP